MRAHGVSKKLNEYVSAVALHFMAPVIADQVWEVADIVRLLDDIPEKPNYQDEAHYGAALGHDPGSTMPRRR